MCDIAVLHGERITLRGPRESDVDDRLAAGKPVEFVYMCGGNRAENDAHAPRAVWELWHNRTAQPQVDEICWRMGGGRNLYRDNPSTPNFKGGQQCAPRDWDMEHGVYVAGIWHGGDSACAGVRV